MDDEREPYHEEREEKRICFISVYSMGRQYGGPEEGGWYYNTYELVASVPMRATATIRITEFTDDDHFAGGYDPKMVDDAYMDPDIRTITRGEVKEWDVPQAFVMEMDRLAELYPKEYFLVTEEVFSGELARRTRMRYC